MKSKRRSDRIDIIISIEVMGDDFTRGRPFCQQGETRNVSRHGAAVALNCVLATNQELTIRSLTTNEEAQARVVGVISQTQNHHVYGVAFVDTASSPWGIEFPPLTGADETLGRIVLACPLCSAQKVVHLNEIEIQVFEPNQKIERFCNACSQTTGWRPVANTAILEPHLPKPTVKEPESKLSEPNRRKHGRIASNVSACIRQRGLPDETVACDNISRGGVSCRASKSYKKGVRIDIAVPYTAGTGNIFVPAQVVYVRESEGFFRLGIAYDSGSQQRSEGYSGTPTHGIRKDY
jgi:hypothetical protein